MKFIKTKGYDNLKLKLKLCLNSNNKLIVVLKKSGMEQNNNWWD